MASMEQAPDRGLSLSKMTQGIDPLDFLPATFRPRKAQDSNALFHFELFK
jgi:hypothetical protein